MPSEIKAVALQAGCYRQAIQSSIAASQKGHTIAEEAITILSFCGATRSDHESYLIETYNLAAEGHELAQKCSREFRDVRSTVFQVCPTDFYPFCLYLIFLQLIEKAQKKKWNPGKKLFKAGSQGRVSSGCFSLYEASLKIKGTRRHPGEFS